MRVRIQRRVWECVPGCTHHILLVFSARRYHHYSNHREPSHRFWDGWSPHPPFPTCPSQPEISCGKLTLRPARSSDLCMQLPPQTELKPHEKHPAGKNKSLTWKGFHCQQEPQGSWGQRVTGVRSSPMLVGRGHLLPSQAGCCGTSSSKCTGGLHNCVQPPILRRKTLLLALGRNRLS